MTLVSELLLVKNEHLIMHAFFFDALTNDNTETRVTDFAHRRLLWNFIFSALLRKTSIVQLLYKLKCSYFRCVHITDIGIGYISTMLALNTLYLRWCTQIRDFGLQHICGMRSMKVLSLAGKLCRNKSYRVFQNTCNI